MTRTRILKSDVKVVNSKKKSPEKDEPRNTKVESRISSKLYGSFRSFIRLLLAFYHKKHPEAGVNKDIIRILSRIQDVEKPEERYEVKAFVDSLKLRRVAVPK